MNYCHGNGVQNCVLCWEVVPFSEGPLSEVPLYLNITPSLSNELDPSDDYHRLTSGFFRSEYFVLALWSCLGCSNRLKVTTQSLDSMSHPAAMLMCPGLTSTCLDQRVRPPGLNLQPKLLPPTSGGIQGLFVCYHAN